MPPFKILTATHYDGEKLKRYGCKAPTFDAWLEIFLEDGMPDYAVAVLLNLDKSEVAKLRSCIRHELRFRTVAYSPTDVYYPVTGPERELLCLKGFPPLGWHLSPSNTTTLIRSTVVFVVSLEFPHLFKEPASLEEYRKEWTPNTFNCYSVVPHHFRRDVLARLVDICAEEMKQYKHLRTAATDPMPYTTKPASSFEVTSNTSKKKLAHTDLPQTDSGDSP